MESGNGGRSNDDTSITPRINPIIWWVCVCARVSLCMSLCVFVWEHVCVCMHVGVGACAGQRLFLVWFLFCFLFFL